MLLGVHKCSSDKSRFGYRSETLIGTNLLKR